jgi:hypothetical protein
MTGEQDFESLSRLKEISSLAPALALLVGGLTSSVWLGYRFLLDRRSNRRALLRPDLTIPKPPVVADELPRAVTARSPGLLATVTAPGGATGLVETVPQQTSPIPYAGVSTQSHSATGQAERPRSRGADDTPNPNSLRPVHAHRPIRPGSHRKKQAERRTNVRRSGMTVPVRVTTGGLRLDEMDGTVVDRSQGGLCLDLPEPAQVGQIFRLRSLLYDDMTPWVEVEVRSVRPHGDRWLVGCRFASPLPWGLLLLFG